MSMLGKVILRRCVFVVVVVVVQVLSIHILYVGQQVAARVLLVSVSEWILNRVLVASSVFVCKTGLHHFVKGRTCSL